MITRIILGSISSLVLTLLFPGIVLAQFSKPLLMKLKHKTDIVVMENGDRNTGEIKKMEFGVLYLKSDRSVDTLKLDWERVAVVESIARYEFETITKEVYIGTIAKQRATEIPAGEIDIIRDDGSTLRLKIREIISVHEMGRSFLSRINLSLDAGASFTSANQSSQSHVNLSTSFRKPKYSSSLTISSLFSGEPGVEKTSRHEVQLTANHYLKKKWDAIVLGALLRDNQQDLQLRTTAGGGIRKTFAETNRTLFYGVGGAVYTNENYLEEDQFDRNNAEGLLMLGFSTYRFRGSSFNGVLSVYPSISEPGRVRIDTSFNWKWDIVRDLYFRISFVDNYDSEPPPNGVHNNFSITTSIGWSF